MANDVVLPKMVRVKQTFARPIVKDVRASTRHEAVSIMASVKPGQTVGITVGSRGIQNILIILEEIIAVVKEKQATPVLLSAMGSHGGGTAAGQKEVLDSLGITEEHLGAKVITCEKAKHIGVTDSGLDAYVLAHALTVDAIIPVNRIKTHTSFKGQVESGLMKKLVVGLGGPPGSAQFHNMGKSELLSPLLVDVGTLLIEKLPVIGGIAIIENGYEKTAKIAAVQPQDFVRGEAELLLYSKTLMPSLPATKIDGLIIEEMGKNYSGTGVDTNIIGRLRIQGEAEMPSPIVRYISVLDISDASHGNATGIGLVDFVTQKLIDKVDRKATYLNNLTTTFVTRAFLPMFFDSEKEVIETMMFCLRQTPLENLKLVIIPNTLFLTDCYVSEALAKELTDTERYEIVGKPHPITFDEKGNLTLRVPLSH